MLVSAQLGNVKHRLDSMRPVTSGTFALVCGVNPVTFSNACRGITRIDSETERVLAESSVLLQEVASACEPIWLPNDPALLARLLERVRKDGISPEKIRECVETIFGLSSGETGLDRGTF